MAVPPTQFTDEEIDRLVETFYARVRQHHRLGPIFEKAVGPDGSPTRASKA
jgi:hemoglobin